MEWLAYYQIEPFGEERADLRSAIIASTVYNCLRSKKDPRRGPMDFMPKFLEKKRRQTPEEMQHMMLAALGSKRFKKA